MIRFTSMPFCYIRDETKPGLHVSALEIKDKMRLLNKEIFLQHIKYNKKYWEYKLIRSVFLCIYFKTKWMSRSNKVLSIAAYYFFPSFRQFSNSISKKWLVFEGDPILEPIFDFCERNEPVWLAASFGTTSNQKKQRPENTASAVKHPIWAFPNIFLRL